MPRGDRHSIVRWQFDLTWRLLSQFHLPFLDDRGCLWSPTPGAYTGARSVTVPGGPIGTMRNPDVASPVRIGWLTWHVLWWWDELLTRAQGGEPPGGAVLHRRTGVFMVGTWRSPDGSATGSASVVVLELQDARYDRIVVTVDDPADVVRSLTS